MQVEDATVRPGETMTVTLANGWTVSLTGDGRIDPFVEKGADRPADYLSGITVPRLETFLRTRDTKALGASWAPVEETREHLAVALPGGRQEVVLDHEQRRVTVRTPYPATVAPGLLHAVEARFDPRTGEIRLSTIREYLLEECR